MARIVRDAKLESRAARAKLSPRGKPYYRAIEPGLHLGYRRAASGAGKWVMRRYVGDQGYSVQTLAIADDFSDADGVVVLSFAQAQNKARAHMVASAHGAPYTVDDAMSDYFAFLESEGRSPHSISDARGRHRGLIQPSLGASEVNDLTPDQLRKWRDRLVKAAPRVRSRSGETKHREIKGEDGQRARRSSTNRVWTILRAALNHAFREGKVDSDIAWRKVKPFKGVDAVRLRYLSVAEAQRLINACDPNFRPLVEAALQTGGRYGQLARLIVSDVNLDSGTVRMRSRKGDGSEKVYHATLTDEGVALFRRLCAGRAGDEFIFHNKNRRSADVSTEWRESDQARPMAEAVRRAKIKPPIGFHGLRHTWASHAVMNGVPLLVVARNLGHADTRMVERHYGHLAPSYVTDAIRAGAPRFGVTPTNATAIR